jgi:hypothetical protein
MPDQLEAIRKLNDLARTTFIGCRILITAEVRGLDDLGAVLAKVRAFEAFSEDNDPHCEHDFGVLEHLGERTFWKIDYYDQTLMGGYPDPNDRAIKLQVLTVMLASK